MAGIAEAIRRLAPDDPEAAVTGIWVAILGFVFSPMNGYFVRPEQRTPGGFADLYMVYFNMARTPVLEYHFCIVQCKRPSKESHQSTWSIAKQQLRGYLPDFKPRNRRHQVYGAVAIGRLVEFIRTRVETLLPVRIPWWSYMILLLVLGGFISLASAVLSCTPLIASKPTTSRVRSWFVISISELSTMLQASLT